MKRALMVPIAIALLISAPAQLVAQEDKPGGRDSGVAALLSLAVPGLGSFYAGNSGHGLRHAAIAGSSVAFTFAGLSSCELGILGGPSEAEGCVVAGLSALVFVGNWIWGAATAASDAKEYNRNLQLAPRLVAFNSPQGSPVVGVELVRFRF